MVFYAQLIEELTAERAELVLQRDQVTLQRDALIVQRDALAAQLDSAITQRDRAAAQCAVLDNQKGELSVRCDEVTQQRDLLNSQYNDILPRFHETEKQRDALLASRSWRITKPLRLAAVAVRAVLRLPVAFVRGLMHCGVRFMRLHFPGGYSVLRRNRFALFFHKHLFATDGQAGTPQAICRQTVMFGASDALSPHEQSLYDILLAAGASVAKETDC